MVSRPPRRTVAIIAHRGSSFLAPENTLAAVAMGWRETTTCEVDVRPTRDGRLLVIHDATTKRTAGVDGLVANKTLRELERLDAGSWKGPEWKRERFLPLEEFIAAMPARKRLLVEVKAGPEVVPELARVIRASGKGRRVLIHSFDLETCKAARQAMPGAIIYYLIASNRDRATGRWAPTLHRAVSLAGKANLDGIGANDTPVLTAVAICRLHAARLTLNIWTIDDVAKARRLISIGVDGLITNRPGWLKTQLHLKKCAVFFVFLVLLFTAPNIPA